MTIAERFGWTSDDLMARRVMAKRRMGSFPISESGLQQMRFQKARIVWCAAAIRRQLG